MKKKKSFILSLMMALIQSFTPINASDSSDASSVVTAVFNLQDDHQEQTLYDENGIPVTLTVTRTSPSTRSLTNGQYTIKGSEPGVTMSYQTKIENQKMISVYNGNYNFILSTITDNRLVLQSPTYSYYTVIGKNILGNFTHTLSARISNVKLITSFQ